MTRPIAAYIGMGLSHPIRLMMNRDLHTNVAKLLSVTEARELVFDLETAIQRATEKQPTPRAHDNSPAPDDRPPRR